MTIVALILAYLLGSIPSALWIGKVFYKTDIREHGSGNLGGTNTFRTLGKTAGLIVSTMDILKGTAAVLLAFTPLFSDIAVHPLVLGILAVVGHMYPIFANFRGGKAVATSAGILLGYHWPIFAVMIVVFFLVLKLTKMVSLTSMTAAILSVIYVLTYHFVFENDIVFVAVIFVLASFIIYRHRANVKRILDGTEPKVKWL